MMIDPNTIGTWAAIIAACATVGSLVVAFQQYQTAKAKLKLDLFENRFKVFEATMAVLAEVFQSGRWTFNRHIDFTRQITLARCLFPADVSEKMQQLLKVGVEMEDAQAAMEATQQGGPERTRVVSDRRNAFSFIADEMLTLERFFIAHLQILKA
jgi:hypothetical protein